ncbi:MAG: phosphate acyltransferase, partial [Syntrophomonas sp.]
MTLLEEIRAKAAQNPKRIVLPEGTEERTLKSIKGILDNKIAYHILLGNEAAIKDLAGKVGADL